MSIHLLRKNLGQTLIEVLVTVLFISVSVIALVKFQNYLSYDNSLSQQRGEATLIAIRRLEILKDFNVINNTSGYVSYQGIATGTGTASGANANYTVSWTDRNGNAQSVQMVTNVGSVDPANSAAVA
jgi:Tfp pilus assembly protein PilV